MERAEFLARVSARLGRERPGAVESRAAPRPGATVDRAELVARFGLEFERVGGAVQVSASPAELEAQLIDFLRLAGVRDLASFERSEFSDLGLERVWREFDVATPSSRADFRAVVPKVDVGLSVADLGVASSGSLLFLARPERPRAVTLLPRSHVAILRARALVLDLASACAELSARGAPASSALFVTGPSRTSDIENDLTLGVHGPAAVTVFLLDD